jgi:hypothetical protein
MRTPTPWPLPQHPTHLRELLRPGITADMVASQVRAGALLRLRAGVYLAASAWPDGRAAQQLHPEVVMDRIARALADG